MALLVRLLGRVERLEDEAKLLGGMPTPESVMLISAICVRGFSRTSIVEQPPPASLAGR
ncbi:MAG: hypothetical protein U0793_08495 [Gemmataceae bacterium]